MRLHLRRIIYWLCVWCFVTLLIQLKFNDYTSRVFQSLVPDTVSNSQNLTMESRVPVTKTPRKGNSELIWPNKSYYHDDRIVKQLKFKPESGITNELSGANIPLKKILVDSGLGGGRVGTGNHVFLEDKCLVNTCEIMRNPALVSSADAVLIHSSPGRNLKRTSPHQIWAIYILESPYHTTGFGAFGSLFNWTATYRHDSDIVTPYEKFVRYNESVTVLPQNKSYAAGKTKMVAWFVTNCGARNDRLNYAHELAKYIKVDIYGRCGQLQCPRRESRCFDMLNTDYKFYLSFENSNCRDYITEKFFVNGLQHDVIPIVMGAAPEDYARAAPPHSFIHVDDFKSPEQLAQYLHKLDQNDDLYNEYFHWKGTGTFINTFFWCRLCAMLHETSRESHSYRDLEKWWRGEGVCIGTDNWRQRQRTSKFIVDDYL